MRSQVLSHIRARFQSYDELVAQLADELLDKSVPVPKNKTVAEHLWCVVGSRESYGKALAAGAWAGFDCSMKQLDRRSFVDALKASAQLLERTVASIDDWTATREGLLLDLLEHETMHEGQLIRHMYALEQTLPKSWKWA